MASKSTSADSIAHAGLLNRRIGGGATVYVCVCVCVHFNVLVCVRMLTSAF